MGSQQVFIGFENLYRHFIQDFSRIAISPTTILKKTGSSLALAFRVDDNEVVGGGGTRAESGGNVVKQKVGSIVRNHPEYPEDKEGVHPFLKPQRAGLIAEKAPTKVPVKYANFADVFSPDLSGLPEHTGINDRVIELFDGKRPSKSLAGAPIFFDRKLDGFFWLCINYRGLKISQSRTDIITLN